MALCDLAGAIYLSRSGQSGWTCVGSVPSQNVCNGVNSNWGGIVCSNSGLVMDILLSGLFLAGSLPSSIGTLSFVTHIEVDYNALHGTLPSSFGSLANAVYIDLSYNSIVGNIPSQFGVLTSLTHLSLSDNKLTGSVPYSLCSLKQLNSLSIDGNSFAFYWSCLSTITIKSFGSLSTACSPMPSYLPTSTQSARPRAIPSSKPSVTPSLS